MIPDPNQLVLSPLGLRHKNGLLVTPLRMKYNISEKPTEKHITFIDPDQIDHKAKAANIATFEHYRDVKIGELKRGLLQRLIGDHFNCSQELIDRKWLNNIPVVVADQYARMITRYMNSILVSYAEERFLSYIYKIETNSRYLHVSRHDGAAEALKLLETRYSDSYCKKVSKRMDWLKHRYGSRSAVLLTLTFDPKLFGGDLFRVWCEGSRYVTNFIKKLKIHFKRHERVFPPYISVPECQKSGMLHFHLVFFDAKRLTDWRRIRQYWGMGHVWINKTAKSEKVRNPVHYVAKYITKTFANTNFDNCLTQSMVWLFNKKSFDRSKSLDVAPLNPKSTGEWGLNYLIQLERMQNRILEQEAIWDRIENMFNHELYDKGPPIPASAETWRIAMAQERRRVLLEGKYAEE